MTKALVILFDIDGTLVRCGGAGGQALCDALSVEFSVSEVRSVALHGRTDLGIVNELLEQHGLQSSLDNRQRLFNRYFELLPKLLHQKQALNQARVLPGVIPLLESICCMDSVVCGLMTGNTPTSAKIKLQHFSLWEYFELGVFGDSEAHRPRLAVPAMQIVEEYCGYPISGQSILVVGDTPLDAELAQAMQARCLCVTTGGFEETQLLDAGADHVMPDFSDTLSVLNWIMA